MAKAYEKRVIISLEYEVEVRDKNGKLTSRQKGVSHSYLKQFIAFLKAQWQGAYGGSIGSVSITDTGGNARTIPRSAAAAFNTTALQCGCGVASSAYGVVWGTSDTPNILTTYSLGSQIVHGVGAGQFSYGAQTFDDPTNPSGLIWIFRIIRTATNNSGGTITVKEIGLIGSCDDTGATQRYFQMARDVITPTPVPNGSTITTRYIPKITVV